MWLPWDNGVAQNLQELVWLRMKWYQIRAPVVVQTWKNLLMNNNVKWRADVIWSDLKEGVRLDVVCALGPGAQAFVGVLHQQLPQEILGQRTNQGRERRLAAQDSPKRKRTAKIIMWQFSIILIIYTHRPLRSTFIVLGGIPFYLHYDAGPCIELAVCD